ncbi:MAG: hypothetical protein HQ523_13310 [Lentisphaerae bacterium]|nr:hypothetical protein [Lentisphaerota bacterium]
MMKHQLMGLGILALSTLSLHAQSEQGLALARDLSEANDHVQAAVEYRRLAMDLKVPTEQGALYWMAGYEYIRAMRHEQANRMLSLVEDATPTLETEVYLLRAENSSLQERFGETAFYLESLNDNAQPEPLRRLAAQRLAVAKMHLKDYAGAREALHKAGGDPAITVEAIAAYEAGKDKRPTVGGLLGLIPGLGYAYSGEYGSALRSLILNSLCIWGMLEFADEEQWAGVAVVGFAEITFYSGSIYGGADAAVRYNERRLQQCTETIAGRTEIRPDRGALPVLTLRYEF